MVTVENLQIWSVTYDELGTTAVASLQSINMERNYVDWKPICPYHWLCGCPNGQTGADVNTSYNQTFCERIKVHSSPEHVIVKLEI